MLSVLKLMIVFETHNICLWSLHGPDPIGDPLDKYSPKAKGGSVTLPYSSTIIKERSKGNLTYIHYGVYMGTKINHRKICSTNLEVVTGMDNSTV